MTNKNWIKIESGEYRAVSGTATIIKGYNRAYGDGSWNVSGAGVADGPYRTFTDAAKAAEVVLRGKVAPAPMETTKTIDCTPDYKAMFDTFLRHASNAGQHLPEDIEMALPANMRLAAHVTQRAAILRAVQGYLAPITVAINAATSTADIQALRGVMTDALAHLDTAARNLEF